MDALRKAYRVIVIIGLAMMASLVIYLVIVGLIEGGSIALNEGPSLTGSIYETVQFILLGVSVVVFFVIPMLHRIMLGSREEEGAPMRQHMAAAGGSMTGLGRLTNAAVVTYALCEVPAIFGLVLYFMGRRVTDFYLFLLGSFFFFATYFPRYGQWEEWYRKQGHGQGTRKTGNA